jgi:alkyldihydroxyacetonephosphate synthase
MDLPESVLGSLRDAVGEANVATDCVHLAAYSTDMWPKAQIWRLQGEPDRFLPDAIVRPSRAEEVAEVVRICADHQVALIPYGGGSGVCGGTVPLTGGVVVDLKRMSKIGPLDRDRALVKCEAGVIGEVLERALNAAGMTLGHFPSSIYCSTVGGWVATRGAGQYSSRYGKIEDMIADLRFVDGEGRIHGTSVLDAWAPGVGFAELITGSEGVLGLVTDVNLRVHRLPEHQRFRGLEVLNVESGIELLRSLAQREPPPLVLRLYDPLDTLISGLSHETGEASSERSGISGLASKLGRQAKKGISKRMHEALDSAYSTALAHPGAANKMARLVQESCLVVVGYEGDAATVDRAMDKVKEDVKRLRGRDLGEGPGTAWLARRHRISFKQAPVYKIGAFVDTMEAATTYDNLARLYAHVVRNLQPLAVIMAHFSHAYPDGCSIYFTFSARDDDPHRLEEIYAEVWRKAMATVGEFGAVLSHHHGVGLSKRDRMGDEIGAGVSLIAAAKSVLDPRGVLNPGKLIA